MTKKKKSNGRRVFSKQREKVTDCDVRGTGTKGAQGAHIITCTRSHRRSSLDRCRTGFLTFRVRDLELVVRTGLRTLLVSELCECLVVPVVVDDDDDEEEDDSKD